MESFKIIRVNNIEWMHTHILEFIVFERIHIMWSHYVLESLDISQTRQALGFVTPIILQMPIHAKKIFHTVHIQLLSSLLRYINK